MASLTKKKKYSKKSKKNWRKHTDIKDVEDFLEDLRQEERTGGPVENKPDSSLFFVDTTQKSADTEKLKPKKSRKRKILKQDELLLPDTRIKPVGSKKTKQNKNKNYNISMDSDSSSESEDYKAKSNNDVESEKLKKKNLPKTNFDLWATEVDKQVEDEHYLKVTRRTKIKMPKTVKRKVTELPAVEVCAAGASYNPAYEEHQELLQKAHEKEAKKVKEVEKLNRKVQWLSREDAANLPTWEEEMSQGLFDDEKEDNERNSSDEEQSEDYVKAAKAVNRKTKQQKRKEKLEREQKKGKEAEKDLKLHENEIYRIKSLKKEILMKEKKIEEKKKKNEKVKETELTKTKRLGRHVFEEPNLEIQLSSEITGNLRSLKPEGNLLTDRFKSLQKRNIVECRKPVVPHRKYALKEYEKRSYKQPCIKEI